MRRPSPASEVAPVAAANPTMPKRPLRSGHKAASPANCSRPRNLPPGEGGRRFSLNVSPTVRRGKCSASSAWSRGAQAAGRSRRAYGRATGRLTVEGRPVSYRRPMPRRPAWRLRPRPKRDGLVTDERRRQRQPRLHRTLRRLSATPASPLTSRPHRALPRQDALARPAHRQPLRRQPAEGDSPSGWPLRPRFSCSTSPPAAST